MGKKSDTKLELEVAHDKGRAPKGSYQFIGFFPQKDGTHNIQARREEDGSIWLFTNVQMVSQSKQDGQRAGNALISEVKFDYQQAFSCKEKD